MVEMFTRTIVNSSFILFTILASFNILSSQNSASLPYDITIPFIVDSKKEIKNLHNSISKYNYEQLDKSSQEKFNLINAAYYTYFKQDSARFYLFRAYDSSPLKVCKLLVSSYKQLQYLKGHGEISNKGRVFIDDIPSFDNVGFINKCKIDINSSVKSKSIKEKIVRPEIEGIRLNDQKYRINSIIDWDLQNALDEENRSIVDSLYISAGSLLEFSEEELSIFSFVLHHSDDCEWNMKWTKIIFQEKSENLVQGTSLLQEAIRRMFKKDVGICYKRDSVGVKLLVETLRQEYPKLSEIYLKGI